MAQGCVASTTTVALSQDGIGTLRADSIRDPHQFNPVRFNAAGLAVRPTVGGFGWPWLGDDTYSVPTVVSPPQGFIPYGPELFAQSSSPVSDGIVLALVSWEIQADYGGGANSPFSGISYRLEYSYDHTNWGPVAEAAQASPSGQTWGWHCHGMWPIAWGDTAVHNIWFRMMVAAGNFGAGEGIAVRFSRRRGAQMVY